MARIEVVPVKGLFQFMAFCSLPRRVYAGMEGFAPSLDAERWAIFAHALNPHYKLVEDQKFLARRDGQWVGRISAHVYKEVEPVGASRHQFGALDAVDEIEVVKALTDAAEAWLVEKGATRINGPFSPSINAECGLMVDGAAAGQMILLPWHPPYLAGHVEALGYEKARDLYSYKFGWDDLDSTARARIMGRPEWKERIKVRKLNLEALETETELMSTLFNDAWRDNWGFVPRTKAEFDSDADGLKFVMPPEYGAVVELDGAPAAFVVALPNLFEIWGDMDGALLPFGLPRLISRIKKHKFKSARIVLLGTRKELQNSATGGVVLLSMIEEIRNRASGPGASIETLEAGWVLEDNLPMRRPIEMFGGKPYKTHRIYEKRLGNGP